MAKFVRVNMPVNRPQDTLLLGKEIKDRNTLMGVNSPLIGFVDMVVFGNKLTNANTLQKNGNKAQDDAQTYFLMCSKTCGLAKGQNKDSEGTLYFNVVQIRDILLLKNRGTEETLSTYGFNVVISQTGARRNIRVDMPTKPQSMIELAEAIIEQHIALGVNSPLIPALIDMTAFEALTADARDLLGKWTTANEDAQTYHNQALVILGYAAGQSSDTENTLYYFLCIIRDRLLQKYQTIEESLSQWGFEVIISTATTGHKKGSQVIVQGEIIVGVVVNIDLSGLQGISPQTKVKLENPGTSVNRYYFSATVNGIAIGTFTDVNPGQSITKTFAELGASEMFSFFNVQNVGGVPGNWRVVILA